ncbi:hypothetical protein pb186bvf_003822 [Paramecium bursaria]
MHISTYYLKFLIQQSYSMCIQSLLDLIKYLQNHGDIHPLINSFRILFQIVAQILQKQQYHFIYMDYHGLKQIFGFSMIQYIILIDQFIQKLFINRLSCSSGEAQRMEGSQTQGFLKMT